MDYTGLSILWAINIGIIGLIVYFIPSMVSSQRNCRNSGSIFVINIFLGWTLIGWVVALAMACSSNVEPTKKEG